MMLIKTAGLVRMPPHQTDNLTRKYMSIKNSFVYLFTICKGTNVSATLIYIYLSVTFSLL